MLEIKQHTEGFPLTLTNAMETIELDRSHDNDALVLSIVDEKLDADQYTGDVSTVEDVKLNATGFCDMCVLIGTRKSKEILKYYRQVEDMTIKMINKKQTYMIKAKQKKQEYEHVVEKFKRDNWVHNENEKYAKLLQDFEKYKKLKQGEVSFKNKKLKHYKTFYDTTHQLLAAPVAPKTIDTIKTAKEALLDCTRQLQLKPSNKKLQKKVDTTLKKFNKSMGTFLDNPLDAKLMKKIQGSITAIDPPTNHLPDEYKVFGDKLPALVYSSKTTYRYLTIEEICRSYNSYNSLSGTKMMKQRDIVQKLEQYPEIQTKTKIKIFYDLKWKHEETYETTEPNDSDCESDCESDCDSDCESDLEACENGSNDDVADTSDEDFVETGSDEDFAEALDDNK